jgi:hypothetical protein
MIAEGTAVTGIGRKNTKIGSGGPTYVLHWSNMSRGWRS